MGGRTMLALNQGTHQVHRSLLQVLGQPDRCSNAVFLSILPQDKTCRIEKKRKSPNESRCSRSPPDRHQTRTDQPRVRVEGTAHLGGAKLSYISCRLLVAAGRIPTVLCPSNDIIFPIHTPACAACAEESPTSPEAPPFRRRDPASSCDIIPTRSRSTIVATVNMLQPCCMCCEEAARYRCPRCRLPYCSVGCCKKHKEACLPKEAKEALSSSSLKSLPDVMPRRDDLLDENDEPDAVPMQKLMLLGKSEELKALLLNTHLQQLLVTLDQTEGKDQALKKYMQEPLFIEFADRCLSLVDAEEKENLYPK